MCEDLSRAKRYRGPAPTYDLGGIFVSVKRIGHEELAVHFRHRICCVLWLQNALICQQQPRSSSLVKFIKTIKNIELRKWVAKLCWSKWTVHYHSLLRGGKTKRPHCWVDDTLHITDYLATKDPIHESDSPVPPYVGRTIACTWTETGQDMDMDCFGVSDGQQLNRPTFSRELGDLHSKQIDVKG